MNIKQLQTPIAIVVAGIIVAVAIVVSGNSGGTLAAPGGNDNNDSFGNNNSAAATNIRAVGEEDHVFGSRDAEVFIVEYSDFECPFCSRLHPTLERAVNEYDGKVAWVYRHFPLTSIHSRAQRAAVASECVAELGGNDAFWEFSDGLFEGQRSLDDALYQSGATSLGIDLNAFNTCMDSNRHDARVAADLQNAIDIGGRGTPFSVVLDSDGNPFPFSGALPYEQVKSIIDQALSS